MVLIIVVAMDTPGAADYKHCPPNPLYGKRGLVNCKGHSHMQTAAGTHNPCDERRSTSISCIAGH